MDSGSKVGGIVLLIVGVFFLLMNFDLLPGDFWKFWPFIPIAIGIAMLLGYEGRRKK
ncbi:MAG: DUF5668 domain-containing protein [Candidatus Micrarchaeia archaeon]